MRQVAKLMVRKLGYELVALKQDAKVHECGAGTIYLAEAKNLKARFLVLDPKDSIQNWHASGRFYEEDELKLILRYFKGGLFVDVGCNVGNHAIFVALAVPESRILAFEPNPHAFAMAVFNVAQNRLHEQITIENVGLSNADAVQHLYIPSGNLGGAHIAMAGQVPVSTEATVSAQFVVGSEVLKTHTPAFVKIDVEGHEISVLDGLWSVILRDRPSVFVEVQPATKDIVIRRFDSANYQLVESISHYEETYTNLLFIPLEEVDSRPAA